MKRLLSFAAILVAMIVSVGSGYVSANDDPTDYPYQDSTKGEVDQWNFFTRYCTSYAAYKADEIIGNFHNTMTGPNGTAGRFGDANNWDNNATTIGFTVNSSPVAGSIVVWEIGAGDSGNYGHVAYVESVNANGTFNISEYNWNYGDGNYNTRSNLLNETGANFIVFESGSSSCTPPPSGDWIISQSCKINQAYTVPANLIVTNSGVLTVKNTGSLNIDLVNRKIEVEPNGKILVEPNGKIF